MEQFDYRRQFHRAAAAHLWSRRIALTQKQQRGPQPLPSPTQQITDDLRDGLVGGSALARQLLLNLYEIFSHKLKDFLYGE
jgi:hypothetical protein